MKFSNNFTRYLMAVLSLVFVLVVATTIIIGYIVPGRKLKEEYENINMTFLNQASEGVDMMLQAVDNELMNFMQDSNIRAFLEADLSGTLDYAEQSIVIELQNVMQQLKYINTNIHSIYIYSAKSGKVLTDENYIDADKFYDLDWINDFNQTDKMLTILKTRVIQPSDGITQKNIVSILRPYPLTTVKNQVQGAVLVNIEESTINDMIVKTQDGQFDTFIVDVDGNVISHGQKTELRKNYREEAFMSSVFSGQDTGSSSYKRDSIFYVTSRYTGWKYVSMVPSSEMNRMYDGINRVLIPVVILLLIGAAVLIIFVMRLLFKPIDSFMASMAHKISEVHASAGAGEAATVQELEGVFGSLVTDYEKVKGEAKGYLPLMKWRLLMDILMGEKRDYDEARNMLDYLGIHLDSGGYAVMLLEVTITNPELMTMEIICRGIEELIREDVNGAVVDLYDSRIAVLLSFETGDRDKNTMAALTTAEMLKNVFASEPHVFAFIGVGSVVDTFGEVSDSYAQAVEAVSYCVLMGNDAIISAEDISGTEDDSGLFEATELTPQISQYLKRGDMEQCMAETDRLFAGFLESRLSPETVYQVCVQLMLQCIRVLRKAGISVGEIVSVRERIYETRDMESLRALVKTTLAEFGDLINRRKAPRNVNEDNYRLAQKVCRYIEKNYMDVDLSLSQLADAFHISAPHLSRLFKENMETNFIDYLISTRIERAKSLLLNTDCKVSEVAEKVGYNSLPSFLKIFKKYTGRTPSEYRREHR